VVDDRCGGVAVWVWTDELVEWLDGEDRAGIRRMPLMAVAVDDGEDSVRVAREIIRAQTERRAETRAS
jgi:hypothetical protein